MAEIVILYNIEQEQVIVLILYIGQSLILNGLIWLAKWLT